jgi:hypothetical protein
MLSFCSQCSGWLLTLVYQPRFCSRCGGGGRLGDNLINQTISILGKFAEVRAKNIKKLWKMLEINRIL